MVKRGDWVKTRSSSMVGFVKRVARDGSWADVKWQGWSKRMPTSSLEIMTTIPVTLGGQHGAMTDMTREAELAALGN